MAEYHKYPGYTAILPPRVRYDQELKASAKLLYAEITAMTDVTGYCWASNRYLAALFGVTKGTVSELLRQLEARGYIQTEVIRDEKNAVNERRVYLTDLGVERLPPITKNRYRGITKNPDTPITKNPHTTMNNNNINNPPYSPPRGGRSRDHKKTPDHAPEMFEKLWLWYPGDPERHSKRGNRQRAIRAWDRLRPDDGLIDTIAGALARQAKSEEWQEGVGIPHLSTYLNGFGWEGWTED